MAVIKLHFRAMKIKNVKLEILKTIPIRLYFFISLKSAYNSMKIFGLITTRFMMLKSIKTQPLCYFTRIKATLPLRPCWINLP